MPLTGFLSAMDATETLEDKTMALTIDQLTITEIQEQLSSMYTARARGRRVPGHDHQLSTINAAQQALDNVYAAYS